MTPAETKVVLVAEQYRLIANARIDFSRRESADRAAWRTLVQDNPELRPFERTWFATVGGEG